MTKARVIEIGFYEKETLKGKMLVRADSKFDYVHNNVVGKTLVDEKGNRIGKVLDVIGNINEPYLLVNPVNKEEVPKGKLYVILEERKKNRRGRK
ncbi:MAG: H/ACA RNA-protein complex protein Gar1 [Candidatus Aramenus sp.]|nr:H/ACA RNA-protein complex protein Gar1 [Candidatus Aramenus sp.]